MLPYNGDYLIPMEIPMIKFSFVEKIIRSKKKKSSITLINGGLSLRDFIHIDDVGKIYSIF